jgi:hypothetical protein
LISPVFSLHSFFTSRLSKRRFFPPHKVICWAVLMTMTQVTSTCFPHTSNFWEFLQEILHFGFSWKFDTSPLTLLGRELLSLNWITLKEFNCFCHSIKLFCFSLFLSHFASNLLHYNKKLDQHWTSKVVGMFHWFYYQLTALRASKV